MSYSDKDASLPPSYTETISSPPRNHSILTNLTNTRTSHIHSIISTSILPPVQENAAHGISKTTIALLPSDIPLPPVPEKSEFSFDNDASKSDGVEVIGFSSDDEVEIKIVRLEGRMNRTEFWKGQGVVGELERVLRDWVNGAEEVERPTRSVGTLEDGNRLQQSRRRFLSRLMPSLGPEQRSPGENPEVGTRAVDSAGSIIVKARLEEICLRTVNDFGLYDTMSKQCIIIKVDAGF